MGRLQVGEVRPIATTPQPRCLSREKAAEYLSVSTDQIDRLIHAGRLPVVKLPVETNRVTGRGRPGVNRRVLIDVRDIDKLIDRNKVHAE